MSRHRSLLALVLLLLGVLGAASAGDAAEEAAKPEQTVDEPQADAPSESGRPGGAEPPATPAVTDAGVSYASVADLLRAIPPALMPPGNMSTILRDAFTTWASEALPGNTLVVDGSVDTVTTNQAGDVIVRVSVSEAVRLHGRSASWHVYAVFREGEVARGLSALAPESSIALTGTLAKADPLVPERRVVKKAFGTLVVNGWTETYAFFGVNLEDCECLSVFAPPVAMEQPGKFAPTAPGEPAAPPQQPPPAPDEAAPPPPPPPPPRPSADFFAVKSGPAARIVYVVDRSGSMTDSIDYVKYELKRSIRALAEEQMFDVIFYSSGPPVEMPPRRFADATERNKQLAVEFIDSVIPQGQTDPSGAFERAFALQPDTIYFLTDGEFDSAIVGLVKRLNAAGKVRIHTIGFIYDAGGKNLKSIAAQNGGLYKFVSEKDLADLVKRGGP